MEKDNRIDLVKIKSKFYADFGRISLERRELNTFLEFESILRELHQLHNLEFVIAYADPHGDLLPITNDDNFKKAVNSAKLLLRVFLHRKGESFDHISNGFNNKLPSILSPFVAPAKNKLSISYPQDFRQVAAIIDVDVVPDVCRRVKLLKHGSDKPLGFYIRDGTSVRVTQNGLERVPGIFISRLVPGGLAESTGLLAVNDEVIEVNGIEVKGRTLDQVTDMMVANSSNLIITVKPANQRTLTNLPRRGSLSRVSGLSAGSQQSHNSGSSDDDRYDQDEIRDLTKDQPLHTDAALGAQDEGILRL